MKKARIYTVFRFGTEGAVSRRMTDEELRQPPVFRVQVRAKSIKQAYYLAAHPDEKKTTGEGIEKLERLNVSGPTSAFDLGYSAIDDWPWMATGIEELKKRPAGCLRGMLNLGLIAIGIVVACLT